MNFYEFSTDDKKGIVTAYKGGQSSKEIADQWDLSPSVVFRVLRKAGMSIRPRGRVAKPKTAKPKVTKPKAKTKVEEALVKRIAAANAEKKAEAAPVAKPKAAKPKAKKAAPRPKSKPKAKAKKG